VSFLSMCILSVHRPGGRRVVDVHGEAGVVAIFSGVRAEGRVATIYGDGRLTDAQGRQVDPYGAYRRWFEGVREVQERMIGAGPEPVAGNPGVNDLWRRWFALSLDFWKKSAEMGQNAMEVLPRWMQMLDEARTNLLAGGAAPSDPLQFAAQWYGLPALFHPITIQSHRVIDGGNPVSLELSNKYVLKGVGKEQVMSSVVRIWLGEDGRIEKVEDRWNKKLPEGGISEVSTVLPLFDWEDVDEMQAFRKLNARVTPNLVKVPKTEEEDKEMMAKRN
jgi:hypothetical protein